MWVLYMSTIVSSVALHLNQPLTYILYGLYAMLQMILNLIENINMQGFIIIRDEEVITSRVHDLASKFLWEVESHSLENKEKKIETVLICRKKFWAIV